MGNVRKELSVSLAGRYFEKATETKENTLAFMSSSNRNLRIAAIYIADSVWNCLDDVRFLSRCLDIAQTDDDDGVRIEAILTLGNAFRAGRSFEVCRPLAEIVRDSRNTNDVRQSAFWAIREIYLGLTDEDLIRRNVSVVKLFLEQLPGHVTEENAKSAMLFGGLLPHSLWESSNEIDWEFINQFN